MIRAALLVAVLTGCAPKAPPSVWPAPVPVLEPPTAPTVEAPADEIPTAAALLPGRRPPYVSEACTATGRGLVLPESLAAELYRDAEIGDWWADRAQLCDAGRRTDRVYCDQVVARLVQDLDTMDREARWIRWAVPGSLAAGIVIGALASQAGATWGTP